MSLDLLDAEAFIIARLKAKITNTTIASTASIAAVLPQDVTKLLPAVFVQPDAGELAAGDSTLTQIAETGNWIAVVVVKLLPDTTNLAVTYQQQAGTLMGKVVEALSAWNPGAGYLPMSYLGRETPEISHGYAEFPLRFAAPRYFAVATP